jgi:hypothetical protein
MILGRLVDGVLIDPEIPPGFWSTPMEKRPASHLEFWEKAFVLTVPHLFPPRFDVYCLDGGAWQNPTCWGRFSALEDAIRCALSSNGLPLGKWNGFWGGSIADAGWKSAISRALVTKNRLRS